MDLIRLACISTPGYSGLTGVARKSTRPGAVVPTSTTVPFSSAGARAGQHVGRRHIAERAAIGPPVPRYCTVVVMASPTGIAVAPRGVNSTMCSRPALSSWRATSIGRGREAAAMARACR
jgi:hypothetical protein